LAFAVFLVPLTRNPNSPQAAGARSSAKIWGEIGKGFHFVLHEPVIRAMLINTFFFSLAYIGPIFIGVSLIAKNSSHGAATMGLLFSTYSAGNLIGSLLPTYWTAKRKRYRFFTHLPVVVSLDLFAIGRFASILPLLCILFFVLGIYFGFINVFTRALRQSRTPIEWQARVSSVLSLVAVSVLPVSLLSAGALANRGGATIVFWYSATLVLLAAATLACDRGLRQFD
jgi:predicted MFS family arabinose efflux permease